MYSILSVRERAGERSIHTHGLGDRNWFAGLPCSPVVKNLSFHCRAGGGGVQFLIREQRSPMPCGSSKRKRKRNWFGLLGGQFDNVIIQTAGNFPYR